MLQKSDATAFQVGEWFSVTHCGRVTALQVRGRPNHVQCRMQDGQEWVVSKQLLSQAAWSAHQFTQEQRYVSRERLAGLLEQAGDAVFTVHFYKQPDATIMATTLAEQLDDLDTAAKRRRLCRDMLQGEPRTLMGRLQQAERKLGRFLVHDLNVDGANNVRLVDARTIVWLIIRGVKYVHT